MVNCFVYHHLVNVCTLKMLDRLRDHISLWSEEKVGIDRRLLVNEKIAEDCLERMKLSTSGIQAVRISFHSLSDIYLRFLSEFCKLKSFSNFHVLVMDAYFLTNPEVKRFRKTADNVDSLTQEWKLLQKEVRECSVALVRTCFCAGGCDLIEIH